MNREGMIIINKAQQMTSHDVVRELRRILDMKKIGHTGTLDPMATGVLPVCLGSATRIIEYLDMDFKRYRCQMRLGLTTDTQDIWGSVLEDHSEAARRVSEADVRAAFLPFSGRIMQKPPMYSAVRVDGRRLYEYARAGEQVEVKSREIFIRALEIEEIDLQALTVTFCVECSKGTYIRTICQDAGAALGCGAAMSSLVRLQSGRFALEHAVSLEMLKEAKAQGQTALDSLLEACLLPTDYPLVHFGKAVLDAAQAKRFVDGWHIAKRDCRIEREPAFAPKAGGCADASTADAQGLAAPAEEPPHVRDEYRRAYNLYREADSTCGQPETFLGVAFYDLQYKKLVADKVLYRHQEE